MSKTDAANHKRVMLRILNEVAAEQDIALTTFSQGWIIRLEKAGMVRFIYGYSFDLNTATAQLIASDKSAVADLLAYNHIPHVEHRLFLQPRLANYVSSQGSWAKMSAYADQHHYQLVVKPNDGTGGNDVYHVTTQLQLEQVVQNLFATHRAICLSPFYKIQREYRVIVLNGQCELVYAKRRPRVFGDGRSTLADLIAASVNEGKLSAQVATHAVTTFEARLDRVLEPGESLPLDWRHNLGQGAVPAMVTDRALQSRLQRLALQVAAAIQIDFASIDLIEVEDQLRVLEANSGVMMEGFAQLVEDGFLIAKRIYARAIASMFE